MSPAHVIEAIRNSFHDAEHIYMHGGCFEFFKILRTIWPEAEPYYDAINGHVYTKISGSFYDIRGRVIPPTDGFGPMERSHIRTAHRWKDVLKSCHE